MKQSKEFERPGWRVVMERGKTVVRAARGKISFGENKVLILGQVLRQEQDRGGGATGSKERKVAA